MPIRLPSNLPAFKTLSEEGVMMMSEDSAERQDIRPLEIGLLNLMPEKEKTERIVRDYLKPSCDEEISEEEYPTIKD